MSTVIQKSFSGGEITPSLHANTDLNKYATSLKTCKNCIVLRHGGAANRPGTEYICEVKDSSKAVRLIPFIFNSNQTYILEFGENYIRFIRNQTQIEVSGVSAWVTSTSYTIGDLVSNGGTNYYCILGHTSGASDEPGVGGSYTTYWYALTGTIYEIPTTYQEEDLATLNFDQNADVVTITHPNYAPMELARTGHTAWTLSTITFAPSQAAPTSPSNSSSGTTGDKWKITAINSETFEESLPTSETESSTAATSGSPITVSWTAASGAGEYNIYKESNGVYGFIGVAVGTSFVDNGIEADTTDTPPSSRNPFSGSDNYPSTSTYYQQRHGFANTNNNLELAEFSRTSNFYNFTRSSPLQDDDAVSFSLVGNRVNEIKHMRNIGKLIMFSSGGEWVIKGDDAGILKPASVNADQVSYHGCSDLRPLIVGSSALFVQARGSVVRNFINDTIDGYLSEDLSLLASHLFDKYTIVDWDYQEVPNSIVWAVRSDGLLLGFTYIRSQRVFAWHQHNTDGTFENCAVIPEGNQDYLYTVVNRTINSSTVRYIERLSTRLYSDIEDAKFMDSSLSLDGTNTTATTMTLSGGTNWTFDETLTLTASASFFSAGDVGNEIHLTGSDGSLIRFTIDAYSSVTVVTGKPHKTVPSSLQSTATAVWGKAVDTISGLSHLEGEDVTVFADGFVIASPNNSSYETVTVSSGSITLSKPRVVIHVGLPYISDIETLNVDSVNGETMIDKQKLIEKVNAYVEETRGVFAGTEPPSNDSTDPLEGLYEYQARNAEDVDSPVSLETDVIQIDTESNWDNNGRVFIRQVDPVPMSILSIAPSGLIPFRR